MKIITLNLTEWQLDCLAKLVDIGRFPNRSDAMRYALNIMIRDELKSLVKQFDLDELAGNDLVPMRQQHAKPAFDMRTKQAADEIRKILGGNGIETDMDRKV